MFRSLRARLGLTYALIILIILVGSLSILVLVARSLPQRQINTRLQQAVIVLFNQAAIDASGSLTARQKIVLDRASQNFEARLLVLDAAGGILYDTAAGMQAAFTSFLIPARARLETRLPYTSQERDENGQTWLYAMRQMDGEYYLVAAAPRPALRLTDLWNDELLTPLVRSVVLAFALAILLSILMSSWVSAPLQKIAEAARRVAQGEFKPIQVEGPEEVHDLSVAFNEMVARVQSSQQSQRDFVANVSHELKTPLTSIQGFAQALVDGTLQDPAGVQQAGEVIYAEAGRMHRMVLDLLELARLDSGAAAIQRRSLDLELLLRQLVEKFVLQARNAQVELVLQAEALPPMLGDGDRLVQVFTNLVDNALKHTPAGGKVSVQAQRDGEWVLVSVGDTGPGIPLEDQKRIFERFYQVDKARPGGGGRGFGLGLAIAREIVQAHGGSIGVRSQAAQGATFIVKLPLALPDDPTLRLRKPTRRALF